MIIGRLLCFLGGVAVLCFGFIPEIISRRKCTEKVVGRCVGHKRNPGGKGSYTPEYEIIWHGQPIVIHSKWYKNHPGKPKPDIGKEVMLRVNPNNPLEFCTNEFHIEWGIVLGSCVYFGLIVFDIVKNGL